MTRNLVHLVLALTFWSAFYCGLAALGLGTGPGWKSDGERSQGCGQEGRTAVYRDTTLDYENALATAEYPTELGTAIRVVFERHSCRIDEDSALGRIRELVDRNEHVRAATVERQYVHLTLVSGLNYVVHLNRSEPDCAKQRVR
jgi:hypothetical protein